MTAMEDPALSKANGATDADWTYVETPRTVGDHARQIRHDATTLVGELQRTAADVENYLTESVRQRPYATLSVAAGLGYVIGGGLATRFTVVLLGVATRLATAVAMREVVARHQPSPVPAGPNTSGPSAVRPEQWSHHED